jgi:DNA-binding LytR/AlgR family response regulator
MNRAALTGFDRAGALVVTPASTDDLGHESERDCDRVAIFACAEASNAVCDTRPKWRGGHSPTGDSGGGGTVVRIAARQQKRILVFDLTEALAFEAKGRHCFVHSTRGVFAVDLSLVEIEASLGGAFIRVHRNWLANEGCVREIDRRSRAWWLVIAPSSHAGQGIRVPVARELSSRTKARLLAGTVGLRHWRIGRSPLRSELGSAPSSCRKTRNRFAPERKT